MFPPSPIKILDLILKIFEYWFGRSDGNQTAFSSSYFIPLLSIDSVIDSKPDVREQGELD